MEVSSELNSSLIVLKEMIPRLKVEQSYGGELTIRSHGSYHPIIRDSEFMLFVPLWSRSLCLCRRRHWIHECSLTNQHWFPGPHQDIVIIQQFCSLETRLEPLEPKVRHDWTVQYIQESSTHLQVFWSFNFISSIERLQRQTKQPVVDSECWAK